MKARYRYRIYPTNSQKVALAKLFGCFRVVYNDALAFCLETYSKGEKYLGESELQKRFITVAKQTDCRQWLNDVSSIPLQQSIRDLGQAYKNFFQSCTGKRKGKKVRPPKFKKRTSAQSARFRTGGFKVRQDNVYLAKIGKLKIVWSRPLPSEPSSVTVIKDASGRYFLSFVLVMPDNIFNQTKIDNSHFPNKMAQLYLKDNLVLCKAIAIDVFGKCDEELLLKLYDLVFQYDCYKNKTMEEVNGETLDQYLERWAKIRILPRLQK
jgi:putative transposase